MKIIAPQKGTNIAHRHGFDTGASQLRGHCFVTKPWLYTVGARVGGSFHKLKKKQKMQYIFNNFIAFFPGPQQKKILWTAMHYGSGHGHTKDSFMLGTGVKCNKLLKNYCIFCFFLN